MKLLEFHTSSIFKVSNFQTCPLSNRQISKISILDFQNLHTLKPPNIQTSRIKSITSDLRVQFQRTSVRKLGNYFVCTLVGPLRCD